MIKRVELSDLPDCLNVIRNGYETVANEFGMTAENCPDRGRADLPLEKLQADFERGVMMYCYVEGGKPVGFIGMSILPDGALKLQDIVILPDCRGRGIGNALMAHCLETARKHNTPYITLGMIAENTRLMHWYETYGFKRVGTKLYDGAPFTVAIMERRGDKSHQWRSVPCRNN